MGRRGGPAYGGGPGYGSGAMMPGGGRAGRRWLRLSRRPGYAGGTWIPEGHDAGDVLQPRGRRAGFGSALRRRRHRSGSQGRETPPERPLPHQTQVGRNELIPGRGSRMDHHQGRYRGPEVTTTSENTSARAIPIARRSSSTLPSGAWLMAYWRRSPGSWTRRPTSIPRSLPSSPTENSARRWSVRSTRWTTQSAGRRS